MPAILGVESSVTGKNWQPRGGHSPEFEREALAIAQRYDLSDLVARVIANRGVSLQKVEKFLNPTLRDALPDPSSLKGIENAVARLTLAIQEQEKIGIFADYDVDGATSAALLTRFLHAVGADSVLYVPDRTLEGYGPNINGLKALKEQGAGVVITLDCGIVAFDVLDQAANNGLDVVVVDHHIAETTLPRATAVVNPNRVDESGELGHLAAVGVTFLLVIALNRGLRDAGWYKARPEPNLMEWLDLVALGTVCDVVALTGLNRSFVAQGLKVMAQRHNSGIRALSEITGLDRKPDAYHLGYVLGPRINAAGRVGDASLGARLLSSEDDFEVFDIARTLEQYNAERKSIESLVLEEATAQAEQHGFDGPVIVVAGEGWHPGVIGIVAGRLRERFNRPACVVTLNGDTGKGSGRSVQGLAMGAAVIAAHQSGVLIAGGGHAMAAGFTVERNKIDTFREFLSQRFNVELSGARLIASMMIDGILAPAGARRDVVDTLERMGPFGSANPEPRFVISPASIYRPIVLGGNHVRCVLMGKDGGRLKAIAFRAMDGNLGSALLQHDGRSFHVAGHLRADDWQGRRNVQLFVDDVALI